MSHVPVHGNGSPISTGHGAKDWDPPWITPLVQVERFAVGRDVSPPAWEAGRR